MNRNGRLKRGLVRLVGAGALVATLGMGTTVAAFAASQPGAPPAAEVARADAPDALPAGAISRDMAQQDALKNYPGGTAVFDSVNDSNGAITFGFTVAQNGKTYDVQVDALKGIVVQAEAGESTGPETSGSGSGGSEAGGAEISDAAANDAAANDAAAGGSNG